MSWNGDNLQKTWIRSKRFGETKGQRETLCARGMSEIIATEMNVVFLWIWKRTAQVEQILAM